MSPFLMPLLLLLLTTYAIRSHSSQNYWCSWYRPVLLLARSSSSFCLHYRQNCDESVVLFFQFILLSLYGRLPFSKHIPFYWDYLLRYELLFTLALEFRKCRFILVATIDRRKRWEWNNIRKAL